VCKPFHSIGDISRSMQQFGEQCLRLEGSTNTAHPDNALESAPNTLVHRALEKPIDFPALAAATVPGDRVAIAVGDDIPHVAEVVRGAVESFEKAGVDTEAISIVTIDAESGRLCREGLGARVSLPQFVVHDPHDKDNLCLVGLTKKDKQPVVVNRTIFDADVVLPIGCARSGGGAFDCLFPGFSNAEAIERFRTPANVMSSADVAKRQKEANEAGWLIGILMAMQVVPGPNESVAHVVAGDPDAVARRCEELYQREWSRRSPRQVKLVIANVSGGAEAQNWQNVGRALANAEPLLDEGGAVVVCSNLEQPPGESLGRLIGSDDLEKAERKIFRDHAADSVPAWHAARALQRGPVYFLSRLDDETVEDLGFAPVNSIEELARLAGHHECYVVIDDSQHAVIAVD
jgi:nickel-dependent lactate racemase